MRIDAGVVDQDVDTFELRPQRFARLRHVLFARDVHPQGKCVVSARTNGGNGFLQRGQRTPADRDRRTARSERFGDGAADAASATRDDGELTRQVADADVRQGCRPRRRQRHERLLLVPRRPRILRTLGVVTAEFVWMGESLVVMSGEEAEELRRQLTEPSPNPRRRPSEAEIVKVSPEYL